MENLEIVPFEREGKKIAWLLVGDRACMPLGILADMFGIAFFNASKDLTENHELYEGHVIKVEKTPEMKSDSLTESEVRSKTLTCLDLAGVLLWITSLNHKRYEGERREIIISNKRWLVETGQEVLMKKEKPALAPIQMGIGDVFLQCNSIVDKIVEKHNVEPIIATQIALIKTQKITGVDMSDFVKLLPPAPEAEVALLTPTEIANRREMRSNREVNKMLEMMGMQEKRKVVSKKGKETMDWFPTEKGKDYCFSFPYVNNGHSGYQLKWKEAIIPIMDEWERKHPDLFSY